MPNTSWNSSSERYVSRFMTLISSRVSFDFETRISSYVYFLSSPVGTFFRFSITTSHVSMSSSFFFGGLFTSIFSLSSVSSASFFFSFFSFFSFLSFFAFFSFFSLSPSSPSSFSSPPSTSFFAPLSSSPSSSPSDALSRGGLGASSSSSESGGGGSLPSSSSESGGGGSEPSSESGGGGALLLPSPELLVEESESESLSLLLSLSGGGGSLPSESLSGGGGSLLLSSSLLDSASCALLKKPSRFRRSISSCSSSILLFLSVDSLRLVVFASSPSVKTFFPCLLLLLHPIRRVSQRDDYMVILTLDQQPCFTLVCDNFPRACCVQDGHHSSAGTLRHLFIVAKHAERGAAGAALVLHHPFNLSNEQVHLIFLVVAGCHFFFFFFF
eukprot:Rhum_TRINITY_DN14641_c9_g3::Rhum_TRINITY_DN14641_c9_g3_i1::g.103176::m.103176